MAQHNIKKGKAQIFISNIGQINIAKKLFPNNLVVLYLHATHETATKRHIEEKRRSEIILSIQKEKNIMLDEAVDVFESEFEYQRRSHALVQKDLNEIKDIHCSYRDNNFQFDHVLLNTGTNNDLIEQMVNLINAYGE